MVPIKTLLPELKKLVVELADDMLVRSTENAEIDAGLREAYGQIEKGGRTAQALEVWRDDYLDQVAVAWVLACVFVRFMEDNQLIDECWLAGEGERRKLAEDAHEVFFREHPHETDREYFKHVFHEVGKIPAAKDLFAEGKTPLWAVAPSGDKAMNLLKFWREIDGESGHLKRSFHAEEGDTRFLGDLYQELSEKAKKKYALLQTPVFVEEFILDRTLTPAIDEYGLEKVRMIDPTCGSGHFLLGGFSRLFDHWGKRESNEIKAAQRALDGVWGVDINPFAVAIARFRLIVAAVQACGITRLKQAPGWSIHLANGDSLLFGSKPSSDGERVGIAKQRNLFEVPVIYAVEDRETLQEILGQGYHVVVGNPPYIIVRDRSQNAAYRQLYSTCHQKYSLAVPFTQRFWELAIQLGEENGNCGHIGMITANSFMKREFGKKLIEEFFPNVDLTHILDTSKMGHTLLGHGTPTVILFGRSRKPTHDSVRAVLATKGEPSSSEEGKPGLVWASILNHVDCAGAHDEYTSSTDIIREVFNTHPWSIGGGGAAELKELIDEAASFTLHEFVKDIGFMAISGEDDAFSAPQHVLQRHGLNYRPFCIGEGLRDWLLEPVGCIAFPYNETSMSLDVVAGKQAVAFHKFFWECRTVLRNRSMFGKTPEEHGLTWIEYMQFIRYRVSAKLCIAFAFVASHNHFVLERGGKVFKQSAPIVTLRADAAEDDHFALLGLLNSSTACFWMKQTLHDKGGGGIGGGLATELWEHFYEFTGTGLQRFPVPEHRPLNLPKLLDNFAQQRFRYLPESFCHAELPHSEGMALSQRMAERMQALMLALQEELDWQCYTLYGLIPPNEKEPWFIEDFHVTNKDFGGLHPGQRAFEIVMAREIAKGELETTWFERHGSTPTTEIPSNWPAAYRNLVERRIKLIETNKEIALIEKPEYKRRWNTEPWDEQEQRALKNWLLDRLETPNYHKGTKDRPELTTTAQMADVASADADFLQVAALYRGRPDYDVAALVAELVEAEAVPLLPILRYKPPGLRKREVWERTWDFQRQQDAGKDIGDIPVPPKYANADFLKSDYWRLRGKLDVPKERWVSYPHCSTDSDPTLVVGWAGWNHLEQATALIAYYDARKREGWDAKRLAPLLAGLDQLLPWIHQWHPEIDKEFGETAGQSFQTMLEHDAHELGLTLEDICNWQPPAKAAKAKGRRKKTADAEDEE